VKSICCALGASLSLAASAAAQELEPRAYSASPIGANFAAVSYGYSYGAVIFDPTIPVTNARAYLNGVGFGYGHTFALFGSQALVTAGIPLAWGTLHGDVGTIDSSVTRTGFGDLKLKLSVDLVGSPALPPPDFAKRPPSRIIFGASLAVVAPTGQYYADKVINISAHRWAFKPEVGVSYNWGAKLYLDGYAGLWLFANNNAFFPGTSSKSQDPLASFQLHASYTFARRSYFALESTWYTGGAGSVNGGPPTARQDNTRLGALVAVGVTSTQSLKLSYSTGASARTGSDFNSIALAYQILWF
jgi:hypothetical protein